jgi:hypothetical protein
MNLGFGGEGGVTEEWDRQTGQADRRGHYRMQVVVEDCSCLVRPEMGINMLLSFTMPVASNKLEY